MKVPPADILPSQDFLKPKTIEFIFSCIKNGTLDKLPPAPIVRKDSEGNMVAIDGHNLIAVKLYRNEDIDIHLAKSANDGLPETSEANTERNQILKDKYESVLEAGSKLNIPE